IDNYFLGDVKLSFHDNEVDGDYLVSWLPSTNVTNSNTLTPTICPTDSTQQYIIMIEDPLGCAQSVTDTVIVVLSYNSLVWPGDANDDLIANNLDLLPIGLYYGASELQRDSVSNLWIGHASLYWTDTLFN